MHVLLGGVDRLSAGPYPFVAAFEKESGGSIVVL
jgi:hypothetical protein